MKLRTRLLLSFLAVGLVTYIMGITVQQVSRASEQSAAISQTATTVDEVCNIAEQIALAMQNINQATIQSLASTRQAEKAAPDLNKMAQEVRETVERYRQVAGASKVVLPA